MVNKQFYRFSHGTILYMKVSPEHCFTNSLQRITVRQPRFSKIVAFETKARQKPILFYSELNNKCYSEFR